MRNRENRNKLMVILLTLSLLITLLVSMIDRAAASSTYTITNVPTIQATGTPHVLGMLQVDLPTVTTTSYVYMSLPASPDGYSFKNMAVQIPAQINGTDNALSEIGINGGVTITSEPSSNGRIVKITIGTPDPSRSGNPGRFLFGSTDSVDNFVGLNITIPSGVSGEVKVNMSAPSSQIFSGGDIVIARVGTLTVSLTTENIPSIGGNGGTVGIIDIKESTPQALVQSNSSLVFTLPPGFTWRHDAAVGTVYWGNNINDVSFDYGNGDRDLKIKMTNPGEMLYFTIAVSINMDETIAQSGDINITVSGDSNATPTTLTIAKYLKNSIQTDPANGAIGVLINKNIIITYDENIQPGRNYNSISLKAGETVVGATYRINGSVLTIDPINNLDYSVTYSVYIPAGAIMVLSGATFETPYVFSFTTESVNDGGGGGGGGGGSGSTTTQSAGNTSVLASVNPSTGGIVSLGSEASVTIPENALQGNDSVQVSVQKVDAPPAAPSGFMVMGTVYQFIINEDHYNFNKPVTLNFTFDPAKLAPGETPAVYYYNDAKGQWVNIGGTVSGNTIMVKVDHFTKFAVLINKKEEKPAVTLKDITGHWAQKDIEKLATMGIITGYPDGTFKPDQEISRAELTTILVKILDNTNPRNDYAGEQSISVKLKFPDYNSIPDWAKEAIEKGSKKGIIGGYPDNSIRANNKITRAEVASMLIRLLDIIKAD